MITDEEIRELLTGRRWFAGDAERAEVVARESLPVDPPLTQVLVRSDDHVYQVLVDDEHREIDDNLSGAYALLHAMVPDEHPAAVRHLGLEQSNTSFVFDERILLKLYRKILDGPNPDVDVPEALGRAGFAHVPEVLGRLSFGGRDVAALQPFLPGASDGWSLALASLRQLFSEEEVAPEDAGGDFAPEARRLGGITAQLHEAMASVFGSEPADAGIVAKSVANGEMETRLNDLTDAGALARVHGDFHLGQVLRTDERWYVTDFEGEPGRSERERFEPQSPLKDVAGMLRSFDYAAGVAAREQDADVSELARAWERHNRNAFLDAYWQAIGASNLIPKNHDDALLLLEAFELEKALYEVEYERAHRPTWAAIPEAAVERLRVA